MPAAVIERGHCAMEELHTLWLCYLSFMTVWHSSKRHNYAQYHIFQYLWVTKSSFFSFFPSSISSRDSLILSLEDCHEFLERRWSIFVFTMWFSFITYITCCLLQMHCYPDKHNFAKISDYLFLYSHQN